MLSMFFEGAGRQKCFQSWLNIRDRCRTVKAACTYLRTWAVMWVILSLPYPSPSLEEWGGLLWCQALINRSNKYVNSASSGLFLMFLSCYVSRAKIVLLFNSYLCPICVFVPASSLFDVSTIFFSTLINFPWFSPAVLRLQGKIIPLCAR